MYIFVNHRIRWRNCRPERIICGGAAVVAASSVESCHRQYWPSWKVYGPYPRGRGPVAKIHRWVGRSWLYSRPLQAPGGGSLRIAVFDIQISKAVRVMVAIAVRKEVVSIG